MATKCFWLPFETPPLSDGDQIFWSPKKAWGEGHEMAIKTKGGRGGVGGGSQKNGKKREKTNKIRGKY